MRLIRFRRIIHCRRKSKLKIYRKFDGALILSVWHTGGACMPLPLRAYQWPSINLINFFHAIVFNEMARLIHNRPQHIEPFCLTVVALA